MNFMNDPQNPLAAAPPPPPDPRELWADAEGSEHVQHLTSSIAEAWLNEHEKVLVMFYAPCESRDKRWVWHRCDLSPNEPFSRRR